MGSLILLSDFTEENGATWILPASHLQEEQPEEAYFYAHAERLKAKRGSVFYFNLRLWHAAGENHSDSWRNALGIGMIRPYMKQRIDLPRAMSAVDMSNVSDFARQKLGFFSVPPSSLEEYYGNAAKKILQRSEWEKPRDF
jgi:ectoine hydroxylase-related dioxygenase (phytanoyl-CoA dioxygenase family)